MILRKIVVHFKLYLVILAIGSTFLKEASTTETVDLGSIAGRVKPEQGV